MSYYYKCGVEVHSKRVEILQKMGAPITCLAHSTTQRNMAFQVINGKTGNEIQVVPPETAQRLNHLSARAGVGVSRGVKMKHYSWGDKAKTK